MRNNALITPQVLQWARERLDLSLNEASEYLKIKEEALISWENGSAYPTVRQTKEIAKKYKIPYVYFFLPAPPKNIKLPKNQDYRTFANQPIKTFSIELKSLLFDVMQRREVILQLSEELGIEIPQFNYYFDIQKISENTIADTLRNIINVPDKEKSRDPHKALNYFRAALERLGILVFQAADIEPSEMRGLSVFEETYPIIVLNRKDAPTARIFTLMHELVHLVTRTDGICDNSGMSELSSFQIELQCNHIAAQILAPEYLIRQYNEYTQLLNSWNDDIVRQIANKFAVSREVIIGRLLSFNDISLNFYKQKIAQYTQEYYTLKQDTETKGFPPPNVDSESQLGKTYISAVLTAYNQEIITARDAIQYFNGLRLKHFESLERWCFA